MSLFDKQDEHKLSGKQVSNDFWNEVDKKLNPDQQRERFQIKLNEKDKQIDVPLNVACTIKKIQWEEQFKSY